MKTLGKVGALIPNLLRAKSNGNARGAGIRIYVPALKAREAHVAAGEAYRVVPEGNDLVLTRVGVKIRRDPKPRNITAPPELRLRLELYLEEAHHLEMAIWATGDPILRRIAKRLRRRLNGNGLARIDRTKFNQEYASK